MMNVTIQPKRLHGSVTPPPSKSRAHRVLIAAMLAGEKLDLTGMGDSQDIEATARCLRTLGVPVSIGTNTSGIIPPPP